MPQVAPPTAAAAQTARHEGANTNFDAGNHGTLNTAVYADAAHRSAIEPLAHFKNLDTVQDQQLPTEPIAAEPAAPQSTAHGSVGDGSF